MNYNPQTEVIVVHPKNRKIFTVRRLPVSVSFATFDKSVFDVIANKCRRLFSVLIFFFPFCRQILIVDPTDDEENLSLSRLSIVMDDEEEICQIHKAGMYFSLIVLSIVYELFILYSDSMI